MPAAPVDVAEYLTALVGKGRGSCHGAAGGARSVPRVTSGSQKTGCANRGRHVWLGASMARPLWAADVAERAEDTEPQQNRSPHRSEESIFNRPNKLVGMYPLNRL